MKRYDLYGSPGSLVEREDGEWVRHEDALAEVAGLQRELAATESAADDQRHRRKDAEREAETHLRALKAAEAEVATLKASERELWLELATAQTERDTRLRERDEARASLELLRADLIHTGHWDKAGYTREDWRREAQEHERQRDEARAEVERRDALIKSDGYDDMRQHAADLEQREGLAAALREVAALEETLSEARDIAREALAKFAPRVKL